MLKRDNSTFRSLNELLKDIDTSLISERVIYCQLGDFVYFLPTNSSYAELEPSDIELLGECLSDYKIASFPKLSKGFSKRGVESPLILFRYGGEIDHKSGNYRYGLLIVQISVMFARIDGVIAEEEKDQINRIIKNLDFLSEIETTELIARAYYYLYGSEEMDGSPQVRDYMKVGLSRELSLKRIATLSEPARVKLVNIAKSVITSDQVIRPCEIDFLQDIYRVFDWSVRSARGDLEKFANDNYIQLRSPAGNTDMKVIEEIDDVLGDIILDFGEF